MTRFQSLLIFAAVAVFFLLVYLLQPILMPFVVGVALAYMGDPLVDRLERWRINRTVGVVMVFFVFITLLTLALLVLVPILVREVTGLVRDIPDFIFWLQQTTSPVLMKYFGVDPFDIKLEVLRARLTENWQQAGGIATRILAEVTSSGISLIVWAANVVLIPVVGFYLMRDWDLMVAAIAELVPGKWQATAKVLASECDEALSAFLRGQLLIMFLLGTIYAFGLYLVGLDLAILIGMLAGLASIVPYLGFAVGIVAASLAAVFQYQDLIHLFYVAIVFTVGQLLEGMVLTPLLVGDRIGLHPVAVIFAVLAGGQLFGFVGILLALPLAAIIMVFVRHAHSLYQTSPYYGHAKGPETK